MELGDIPLRHGAAPHRRTLPRHLPEGAAKGRPWVYVRVGWAAGGARQPLISPYADLCFARNGTPCAGAACGDAAGRTGTAVGGMPHSAFSCCGCGNAPLITACRCCRRRRCGARARRLANLCPIRPMHAATLHCLLHAGAPGGAAVGREHGGGRHCVACKSASRP